MKPSSPIGLVSHWHDISRFADLPSEEVLGRYLADRDEVVFRELLRRHAGHVWSVCRRELRCPDLAEDAFQMTFVALIRKGHSIRKRGALVGWLDRTARRTAGRIRKRESRRKVVEIAAPVREETAASDRNAGERAEAIRTALAELPERYRLPITYRYLAGLSAAEIATILRIPEETGRTQLKRGIELLRQKLSGKWLAAGSGVGAGTMATEAGLLAAADKVPEALLLATLNAVKALPSGEEMLAAVAAIKTTLTHRRVIIGIVVIATGVAGALISASGQKNTPGFLIVKQTDKESSMRGSPIAAVAAALALAQPAQSQFFTNLVNTSMPIPGGSGNFTSLVPGPISGSNMAFIGRGSNGQTGFYTIPTGGGTPIVIADVNTLIPDGTGNFATFNTNYVNTPIAISGPNVAFSGSASSTAVGGVYIGSSPTSLIRIADASTPAPGSTSNFTGFADSGVCITGNTIVFNAATPISLGSSGFADSSGLYAGSISGGALTRIVDQTTPVPNGTGTFFQVRKQKVSGTTIAFFGESLPTNNDRGIYTVSTTGGAITRIADRNTLIPNGSGNFDTFGSLSISGSTVVFLGENVPSGGQRGVFSAPTQGGAITTIANTSTLIPGGTGNFRLFGNASINDSTISFQGFGNDGQVGLYSGNASGGPISKIIAKGDTLDGRIVNNIGGGTYVNEFSIYTFSVTFTDGSIGIYTFTPVPEPATGLLALAGALAAGVTALRR